MTDSLASQMCIPSRQVPVLYIQGTADPFLPEEGNEYWLPIFGTANYWASQNNCNSTPDSVNLEDVDPLDSCTITKFMYYDCDDDNNVLLYRVNDGGHTWPGGWMPPEWYSFMGRQNNDIHAAVEIWDFFKTKFHPNPIISNIEVELKKSILIYPNPANDILSIETDFTDHYSIDITSLNGQLIFSTIKEGTTHRIDLSSYKKGVYFITIRSKDFVTTRKIIKL